MSESRTLSDLLSRARRGDDAARDRLFEKCRNYIGVVARAQLESWMQAKADPSDLVQQTLLEAHRGFPKFQGTTEEEWLAWLRRILSHNCADFVRQYRCTQKRQARREVRLDAPANHSSRGGWGDPGDSAATPSQLVMQREREVQVADAVAQLPEDYREVILLRNLQRLPFDEVARRMGRSRPAAQMLWMRALRKLQDHLEN